MSTPISARSRKSLVSFGVVALLAMTAATAQVATGTTGIDASGSYQREVKACMSGNTQQDRATCLKEARNARADKTIGNGNGDFKANAEMRCDALKGEDNAACRARIMGYGNTTGSVAGGGVLREVETVTAPPGASAVVVRPQTADTVVIVPAARP